MPDELGRLQPSNSIDPYSPPEIAARIEASGVAKVEAPLLTTLILGVLAGVFISFGAMLYTAVITGVDAGFGPARLLGGIAFSLGLVLVVIGGAELFTGNNLIVMAWADRRITGRKLLGNWVTVYLANFVGAAATALLVHWSGILELSGGASGHTAAAIARAKAELGLGPAFIRGILCNALVCLAVWICLAAHDVAGKILAIVIPISAFVALGFEHSVANMYLIPAGMLAGADIPVASLATNLIPVTLGNIVGGSGGVAIVYWIVYCRDRRTPTSPLRPARPINARIISRPRNSQL